MSDETRDEDLDFEEWTESPSQVATAPGSELPAASVPQAPKGKRPLYQPPSPSDFTVPRHPGPKGPPAPPAPSRLDEFSADFDDDEDGATRVADVPDDLIRALAERPPGPTPPPPVPRPEAASGDDSLDFSIDIEVPMDEEPARQAFRRPPGARAPVAHTAGSESDAPDGATMARAPAFVPPGPTTARPDDAGSRTPAIAPPAAIVVEVDDEPELLLSDTGDDLFEDDDGPELFVVEDEEIQLADELDALLPSLPPIARSAALIDDEEDEPTDARSLAFDPGGSRAPTRAASPAFSPDTARPSAPPTFESLVPTEARAEAFRPPAPTPAAPDSADTAPPLGASLDELLAEAAAEQLVGADTGPSGAGTLPPVEGATPLPEPLLRFSDLPERMVGDADEGLEALLPLEELETDDAAVERLAGVSPSRPPAEPADIDRALGITPSEPPPAASSAPGSAIPKTPGDEGAETARRTMVRRKPRAEVFALVGRHPEALRERQTLLRHLAERSEGPTRARLLSAAAAMAGQLGDAEEARSLHHEAHEADPSCPFALRAVRKDAMTSGEWDRVAKLLEAEAALPVSASDRYHALTLLADLQLHAWAEPESARATAKQALEDAEPERGVGVHAGRGAALDTMVPNLTIAEASLVRGETVEVAAALRDAAAGVRGDRRTAAALRVSAARAFEVAGRHEDAARELASARQADPELLEAQLGTYRASRREGAPVEAVLALREAADASSARVSNALRVAAARAAHLAASDPAVASSFLEGDNRPLSLSARAEAAHALNEGDVERDALMAWAQATGGTEKAHVLVRLAETLGSLGDLDGADRALSDAALADAELGTIAVVREVLARRTGDSARLSRAVEGAEGGSLVAAAKVARDVASASRERELLAAAREDGELPVTADVLSLDAAAHDGDDAAVAAALTRAVERSTPEQKLSPLLALADLERRSGIQSGSGSAYRRAAEAFPGEPLALWPLARDLMRVAPAEAATFLREEATTTGGARGAHAATWAARAAQLAGEDPGPALREALELAPSHLPAILALATDARARGDAATERWLHELAAETAPPHDAAAHLVQAALLVAPEDASQSVVLLGRALEEAPDDTIVHALLQAFGERASAETRAAALERAASFATPENGRALQLRAAAEARPDDIVAARLLDRAELAAGEVTFVAERRFAALRSADDDATKIAALESMASLDRNERADTSSAVLSLRSILELAPGHLPTLRALETHAMDGSDDAELSRVEASLARHLESPDDVAGHLLLATRLLLLPDDAAPDAADALLLELADRAAFDLGLARHILAAAAAAGDDARVANLGRALASHLDDPMERVALTLEASLALRRAEGPARAAELLRPAAYGAEGHPTAAAELARLYEEAEDFTEAAEAYELAARSTRLARRAVAMWHAAGVLWQERIEDTHRALEAFEKAAGLDVGFLDVYPRMSVMLEELGAARRLRELTERRIEAGGDGTTLVELHLRLADLSDRLDEREAAQAAVRAALGLGTTELEPTRRLAELCLRVEEFQGAAEALIALARIARDDATLRWVFFGLGDIYDRHIPDLRRAEAAFKRVVRLAPEDTDALSRVSDVLVRQGNHTEAVRALTRLLELTPDLDAARDVRLRLARAYESLGRPRDAEAVLEEVRRTRPTDTAVLFAMADLYERQSATSALAMHMNRAVADFRRGLAADLADAELWAALADVLARRGRTDAARVVVAAASSMGVVVAPAAGGLDPREDVPGAGPAALEPALREVLAPKGLYRAILEVFRIGSEAFERALPFDPKPWRAQKAPGRDHPLKLEAQRIGKWFGASDVQVLLTAESPRIFMPVGSSPLTVLVGTEIAATTDEAERAFLFARAMIIAESHLAPCTRALPENLSLAVAGLMRHFDPSHAPEGVDPHALEEIAKRMGKGVNRRVRDELGALVREMHGHPDFDPAALGMAAAELGDHTALVALGAVRPAVSALLALEGVVLASLPSADRAAAIRGSIEASRLLSFAISDTHFDARRQAGAEEA